MEVFINNTPKEAAEGESVYTLLAREGFCKPGTAVAVANRVVPRNVWESTLLEPGMRLVVISAVCGG